MSYSRDGLKASEFHNDWFGDCMSDDQTRLLYGFLLHSSRLSDEYREGTNPFTEEIEKFYLDQGIDDEQRDSLIELIDECSFQGPEPDGEGYVLHVGDREKLRLRCEDLEGVDEVISIPVELIVKRLTDRVLSIIFEIAKRCHLVLMSMTGEDVRVIASEILEQVQIRWSDAIQISDVRELET